MPENGTHGSEGGEDGVLLYPYHAPDLLDCRVASLLAMTGGLPLCSLQ